MKRLSLLSILLLCLLVGMVSATSVDVEPLNQTAHTIYFDETAQYTVTISNTDDVSTVFSISVNPLQWVIDSKRSVSIDGNTTEIVELRIRPRPSNFKGPGVYRIPVTVSTPSGETYEDTVRIVIKSIEDRLFEYKPSVAMGMSFKEQILPNDDFIIQLNIRNRK